MTVLPLASLRSRLLIVVVVAITPFVLYAALSATREQSMAASALRDKSLERARVTARNLDEQLRLVDQLLDSAFVLVRQPLNAARRPRVPELDTTFLGRTLTIAVLDTSGRRRTALMGAASRVDSIPVLRRKTLVLTALDNTLQSRGSPGSTYVDEGVVRGESDSIAMVIVRPIVRGRARCNCLADVSGAMVAVLSDRALQTLLGGDSMPAGGVAVLTGSSGSLLGRPASPERWTERDARDTALLATVTEREGVLDFKGQDEVARSIGFAALKRLPWRVYVGVPSSSISGRSNAQLRDALMLAALAFAIASLGVIIASRAFSGPLQTLVADTRRLAAGALSHRTEVADAAGELGALGVAMNSLAETLEAKRKSVHEDQRLAAELFETAPVAMWVADASGEPGTAGRILQANSAAHRLFGVGEDALTGRRDLDLLDASCAPLVAPPPALAEQPARLVRAGRGLIRSADGSTRECELHITFVPHAKHLVRIVTVLELAQFSSTQQTPTILAPPIGAATDSALVAFAGHVADDFALVLEGLAGFSQLALESTDDPDMHTVAVERVRDLSAHGLSLVQQLYAYARHGDLHLQLIDANDTLAASAQSIAETLGTQVELQLLFNVAPALVLADPQLLDQVVTTFIANARDAMPAGGTLTLATTFVEVPTESPEGYAVPAGRYLVLTVADTGMGMTSDARQHLFEPFWSTKRQRGRSTGLGLAAAAGIAQQHGWTLSVDSEPEVGTAISLYMPLADGALPAPVASADQSSLETVPARS